jgi:hypothetical protein
MELPTLSPAAAAAAVAAPVLAIASLVGFVAVAGDDNMSVAAQRPALYVPTVAALASTALLGVVLVALVEELRGRLGRLGAAGALVALVGTVLAAGAQWTYVFVIPHFASSAPDLVDEGSGSVLAGFVISYAVFALGWALLGLALLRAGVYPRWLALLFIAGAALAFLPMPSRTLVLAIAVGLAGLRAVRARPRRVLAR